MTHIVPIDPELLDDIIGLAEAHVARLEAQRTTAANRLAKAQTREIVDRAKDMLREYTAHLESKPAHKQEGSHAEFNRHIAGDR